MHLFLIKSEKLFRHKKCKTKFSPKIHLSYFKRFDATVTLSKKNRINPETLILGTF